MREDILSFVRDESAAPPFFLEMTGVSYCDGSYRIERTGSYLTVLEYVRQGSGTIQTDGRVFTATTGDVYLLHRGSSHAYWSDAADPWVKVWMNVSGPLADHLLGAYDLKGVDVVHGLDLGDLFEDLLTAARAAHGSAEDILPEASILFHRMLARIYGHLTRSEPGAGGDARTLKLWLDRSLYADVSLQALAGQIYRSPSQAIRIFRKAYGVTPYEYLLRRRMDAARLLLDNTALPVKEIAYRLRFADEHYFSNFFKKKMGLSPVQYRRKVSAGHG